MGLAGRKGARPTSPSEDFCRLQQISAVTAVLLFSPPPLRAPLSVRPSLFRRLLIHPEMSAHHLPPTDDEDDLGVPPVVLDTNFPTWIALDGLPKVTKDKLDKLGTVVRKVLGSIGEVRDFVMPFDENTNATKGFVRRAPIFSASDF